MTEPIIRVEHLGKLYYFGGKKPRGPSLPVRLRTTVRSSHRYIRNIRRKGLIKYTRRTLADVRNYLRHIKKMGSRGYTPESLDWSRQNGKPSSWDTPAGAFWVLKDVSFEVEPGEVLGIIGRNGAGKSTLLKILSRITEPTAGQAIIRGRIGSLLEVGTGFHDELTGRENIYLNGTILGMNKVEIDRKLDEIVAFSGVERFLNTPVKYYSSGMRVRLAFSVAAHLDTEILLIDEVLAVGDVAFQEKCLKKMDSLTQAEGRTVLFVSHNMSAIASLCPRSILLDGGQVAAIGPSTEIIPRYYESVRGAGGKTEIVTNARLGSGLLRFTNFYLEDLEGNVIKSVQAGAPVRLVMEYISQVDRQPQDVLVNIVCINQKGQRLFGLPSDVTRSNLVNLSSTGRFVCTIPGLPLIPGNYEVILACLVNRELTDKVVSAATIVVTEGDFYGTGRLPISFYGNTLVNYGWSTEPSLTPINAPVNSWG